MVTIRPIDDKVIVRIDEPEEKTDGGIILTGTAKIKQPIGTVAAVGPGTNEIEMVVNAGDRVVYPQGKGFELTLDDIVYRIFKQEDLYAVIQEE